MAEENSDGHKFENHKNADDDVNDDEDEMTPEEKRREDERLKRMMDELNGDKERTTAGWIRKKRLC